MASFAIPSDTEASQASQTVVTPSNQNTKDKKKIMPRSYLYTANLIKEVPLPSEAEEYKGKKRIVCTQPRCPKYWDIPEGYKTTSNYFLHYQTAHRHVPTSKEESTKKRSLSSIEDFWHAQSIQKRKITHSLYDKSIYIKFLIDFIVQCNLPLRIVEASSFQTLITYLNPDVNHISARTLKRNIIQLYIGAKDLLLSELDAHIMEGGLFSLTLDTWTSFSVHSYMGITVHFISSFDYTLRSKMLSFIGLAGSHDGQYLANVLFTCLSEFQIHKHILSITRDNASNNDTLLEHFTSLVGPHGNAIIPLSPSAHIFSVEDGDVRCLAHVINLAVQSMLKDLRIDETEYTHTMDKDEALPEGGYPTLLAKVRRLIRKIRKSATLTDLLEAQCITLKIPPRKVILDSPTRWNSTYDMFSILLQLRPAISILYAIAKPIYKLRMLEISDVEWDMLEDLVQTLALFKKLSTLISGSSYTTLGSVLPYYCKLLMSLEKSAEKYTMNVNDDSSEALLAPLGFACNEAWLKLKEYYNRTDMHSHFRLATILDPRYKLDVFKTLDWKKRDINAAETLFRNRYKKYTARYEADLDFQDGSEDIIVAGGEDEGWGLFIDPTKIGQRDEAAAYLLEPRASGASNPLELWKGMASHFPVLAKMARDYLAIPATSVPSEQLFSQSSDIITKKRNRLANDSITQIMCLKNWGIVMDTDVLDYIDEELEIDGEESEHANEASGSSNEASTSSNEGNNSSNEATTKV
jgi:hypothetical protein